MNPNVVNIEVPLLH